MASGAWESIIIDGTRYSCKADDSVTVKLPGFKNEVLVAGDGTNYLKKTKEQGSISGLNIFCVPEEFVELKEKQDSLSFLDVSGTMIDGTTVSGYMQITDAVELDSSENVVGITLEGNCELFL